MADREVTITHEIGCGWLIALAIVCFTLLKIFAR